MSFDYATLMNQHAMLQVRCQYWEKECIKLAAERDGLKADLAKRDAEIEEWSWVAVQNGMEVDTLRKQLDEARELLSAVSGFVPSWNGARIDAWMEANKKQP